MMSLIESGVGGREPGRAQPLADRTADRRAHMRQHQVLLVRDANLAVRIVLGELGDGVHLLGAGIAGRARRSAFSETVTTA